MPNKSTYQGLEQRLREHEKKALERERVIAELEEIFQLSLDMIGTGNLNGYFTKTNSSFSRILGHAEREFLEHPFLYFVHDDDVENTRSALQAATKGREHLFVENRYRCQDGSYKWIEWKVLVIASEDRFIAVGREVTDRKLAEDALRKSEERFKLAGQVAYDLIYEWVTKTDSLKWYGDVDGMLGFESGEISRDIDAWLGLIHPDDRSILAAAVERHRTSTEPIEYEYRIRHSDGTYCYWNDHGLPVVNDRGEPYKWIGVCTDITKQKHAEAERKHLQALIHRQERMESLGVMAGGIAHDLNNILAGVVSYPDLLLMSLSDGSPLKRPLEIIKDSGQRAADIVSDLLTISKGVSMKREVRNLAVIVREFMDSAEFVSIQQAYPLISFEAQLADDLQANRCSASHIEKTLMNLILNAAEATEGEGNVTTSVRNCHLDEPVQGYENILRGDYVELSVKDDGVGIPPDQLEHIFEPFYTKKMLGKSGTGLGLAVVWNTIQDHDGYVNVRSDERGTVFDLYFPATREAPLSPAETSIKYYQGHGEFILIVDDEEQQRKIASEMLTLLGYNARSFPRGEEAVEFLRNNKAALIVLDMIMAPGIDGLETYRRIIELHPGQKAIITSGFSETEKVRTAQSLGAGSFVKKPYVLNTLGRAVKRELEKR
jgi:two-component system, cell cycle sensor histidine kinase and response regulator CckA